MFLVYNALCHFTVLVNNFVVIIKEVSLTIIILGKKLTIQSQKNEYQILVPNDMVVNFWEDLDPWADLRYFTRFVFCNWDI